MRLVMILKIMMMMVMMMMTMMMVVTRVLPLLLADQETRQVTLRCFMRGYDPSYGTRPRWGALTDRYRYLDIACLCRWSHYDFPADSVKINNVPVTGVEEGQAWAYWSIQLNVSRADAGIKVDIRSLQLFTFHMSPFSADCDLRVPAGKLCQKS